MQCTDDNDISKYIEQMLISVSKLMSSTARLFIQAHNYVGLHLGMGSHRRGRPITGWYARPFPWTRTQIAKEVIAVHSTGSTARSHFVVWISPIFSYWFC